MQVEDLKNCADCGAAQYEWQGASTEETHENGAVENPTLNEPGSDKANAASFPLAPSHGAASASSSMDLLISRLDQPGIAACRSRLATILRLMQAMTFDSMRSVRKTVTPGQSAASKIDRPMLVGTVELLPVTVGGMEARVEISVVPQDDWLAMRIKASCPPMLGSTVILETVRNDRSNLFSPADGKNAAIAALRRLLSNVVAAERHVAGAMEQGVNPQPSDPARLAAAEHERRMASLLTRAADESDDLSMPSVSFDFCNPYPGASAVDHGGEPFPVSTEAMEWLESQAPSIVQLTERSEGISTVYEFGSYEGSASREYEMDPMHALRIRAASGGAPEGILNDDWAGDFR